LFFINTTYHVLTISACKRQAKLKEQRGFWLFLVLYELATLHKSEPAYSKTSHADAETAVEYNVNNRGVKGASSKSYENHNNASVT
jgi:hypothetical protein